MSICKVYIRGLSIYVHVLYVFMCLNPLEYNNGLHMYMYIYSKVYAYTSFKGNYVFIMYVYYVQ